MYTWHGFLHGRQMDFAVMAPSKAAVCRLLPQPPRANQWLEEALESWIHYEHISSGKPGTIFFKPAADYSVDFCPLEADDVDSIR